MEHSEIINKINNFGSLLFRSALESDPTKNKYAYDELGPGASLNAIFNPNQSDN